MNLRTQKVWQVIKEYWLVILAGILNGISVYAFVHPSYLVAGGITGLSSVVARIVCAIKGVAVDGDFFKQIQPIIYFGLNAPLLIVSLIFLRGDFTFKTIAATISASITMDVLPTIAPHGEFTDSALIAVIFGGVLIGLSMHIAAENNGSNAGTEIIAKLVAKYKPEVDLHTTVLISNFLITILGCIINLFIVEGTTIMIILYSLTYVVLGGVVMGALGRGFDHPQKFMIVTKEYDEISQLILERFKRGLTLFDVADDPDKKVIMVIVQYRQASQLKRIIKKVDPDAFTFVKEVYDVFSRPSFNRSYKTK